MSKSTYKEIMMLLLSVNTEDELRSMLNEDCFNEETKGFIREELGSRQKQ